MRSKIKLLKNELQESKLVVEKKERGNDPRLKSRRESLIYSDLVPAGAATFPHLVEIEKSTQSDNPKDCA